MPVETLTQNKGIRLTHPKGASAEVLFYGATVISWKSKVDGDSEPVERLFVTSKAFLDGSKAVRGGIPVVFPFFGAPTRPEHSKLPQHGYARTATWTWDGQTVMDNDAGVSVKLTYKPDASLTEDDVELAYVMTLAEHQLSTNLHVKNASSTKPLAFQALLHTYIRAPSKSIHISGLSQLNYIDKTQSGAPRILEQRATVDVLKFTDFVYEDGPQEYKITWPDGGMNIKAIGFKDVVVWNPNAEASAKLSDMEEGGWEKFVCVEPGYVKEFFDLVPGQTWIGGQTLTPFKASNSQL
ncbi:galactose mutarotase-like protein [Schizopora paradoxa]|uniref:Glucose-6-phosphate 1-epimerase n=1 Tax=Schizopora paradoxa TaxID=27342 RepID=A0A0H2SE98_9AGAM|nr:galactose mutarotase-like protein [Schizopora paradoxa]